ncbi:MAG TPA: hypothetical protein VMC42_01365 [Methanoregulaceae archaeon]|nr:hypothetical protein [Methanoregulaceae archaeon]
MANNQTEKNTWSHCIREMFCTVDSYGKVNRIRVVIHALLICFILGLIVIVLYGLWPGPDINGFSIVGVGLLLAGGIFFVGGFLGFLFAIPHSPEKDSAGYQPNTNLEQISDWLTKIIVGVGLTQLIQLPQALQMFASNFSQSLGGSPFGGVFSVGILIFFSVNGFLVGYLWTRKYYAQELQQSDIELQQDQQNQIDMDALSAVKQVLIPQDGQKPATQDELDKKIAAASDYVKLVIFSIASNQKNRNLFGGGPELSRTGLIFRSLIKTDDSNARYHENLGDVLRAKVPPAYEEAEKEYTSAIKFRLPQDEPYYYYEGYRAICRINMDKDFPRAACSDPDLKKKIIDDLEAVKQQPDAVNYLSNTYVVIKNWAKLNGYSWP